MTDSATTSKEKFLRWSVIAIAIAAIAIPTFIVMLKFRHTSYWYQYSRLTQEMSEQSGLNLYLIKAAAALLAVPLVYGMKSLYSLSSRRRQIGVALIALSTVLYNTGLFWLNRGANFSLQGKALRWYAITPVGVKYYDRPGVDQEFGIPLKPVTPDVVRYLEELDGSPLALQDPLKAKWFNPNTGDPELWYLQLPNGTFRFFNKPGFDPITGATLQPVSREFRDRWQAQRSVVQEAEQKRQEASGRAAADKEEADRAAVALRQEQEADAKQQTAAKLQDALPYWQAAEARLKGDLVFWNNMRHELSASGGSLRPEIESALQRAQSIGSDCEHSYSLGDGDALQVCTKSLNNMLDKIDGFKN